MTNGDTGTRLARVRSGLLTMEKLLIPVLSELIGPIHHGANTRPAERSSRWSERTIPLAALSLHEDLALSASSIRSGCMGR